MFPGEQKSPLTTQVGGSHYKDSVIQPIQFIQANNLSFCEGNAVKYITRHRKKGGRQDLEKAIHYLQLEIEHTYGSKSKDTDSSGSSGAGVHQSAAGGLGGGEGTAAGTV